MGGASGGGSSGGWKTVGARGEVEAWGHPTFRVDNKIFVGFGADEKLATMG
jgi:hypothetical protein